MNFLLLRVLRRTQRESAEVTAQAGAKLPVKVIRARRLVQAAASVPDLRAVRCLYSVVSLKEVSTIFLLRL
jgi:hypothetical protein